MPAPVIDLQNVCFSFGRDLILDNVSLSVRHGETLVVIGPSGQGKSTLLKIMTGLISPQAGEVAIEGRKLKEISAKEREILARKMGMLFQKNALFDSLTSVENVAFPLREVAGKKRDDASAIKTAEKFLEAVGLSQARDLFPEEISGGMQKRLGIARALALEPQIVFYDDPTAGLDPITSKRIVQLLIDLRAKSKSTVVAVTNDMRRAYQLADRIVMVVDKSVIDCGSPSETKNHRDPRVAQFIRGRLDGPLTVHA